jgi:hypothetical protein
MRWPNEIQGHDSIRFHEVLRVGAKWIFEARCGWRSEASRALLTRCGDTYMTVYFFTPGEIRDASLRHVQSDCSVPRSDANEYTMGVRTMDTRNWKEVALSTEGRRTPRSMVQHAECADKEYLRQPNDDPHLSHVLNDLERGL